MINTSSKKLRHVFVFSFDGITTEDVIDNGNNSYVNQFINEFSNENYFFNNARWPSSFY